MTSVTKIFRVGMFKKKTGVEEITFQVNPGEVVGLLGPNGSGKSTVLKLLLGFLRPTAGEILVAGYPNTSSAARSAIGYLPENPRFQKFLTGRSILKYYGHLLGLKGKSLEARCNQVLDLVSLSKASNEIVQGYSKGMTQRLAIAQALLNEPRLLIFDEPMSGLDPVGRIEIRKLISKIHTDYPTSTILFSSHILSDVEQLCSSVLVLKKGRLTRNCRIEELLATASQTFEVTVQKLPENLTPRYLTEKSAVITPIGLTVTLDGTEKLLRELETLKLCGAEVIGLSSRRKSLEDMLFAEPADNFARESPSL